MTLEFFIPGIPKPGGSKRGFYIAKLKRVVITDACKDSADWKRTCAFWAQHHYTGEPLTGPLAVRFDFYFTRPKGHYGSGKNAGKLKDSAPPYPAVKPDATKCMRSTEDSLTGLLWKDDAQIVEQQATKRYADRPGCKVTVIALPDRVGRVERPAEAPLFAEAR